MEPGTRHERQANEIARWRREQLVAAGFSLPLAARIANDADYDLHALIDLVERGCAPDLAARILAPFETQRSAA